jgi:hypothetical protein
MNAYEMYTYVCISHRQSCHFSGDCIGMCMRCMRMCVYLIDSLVMSQETVSGVYV